MEKIKKQEIMSKFQAAPKDTGSASVQIALLTGRISHLSEHLKTHRKDYHSQMGLLKLVGQRKKFLAWVKRRQPEEYQKLLKQLDIRK